MLYLQILSYLSFGLALLLVTPIFINFLRKVGFYKTKDTTGVDVSKRNSLWYDHLGDTLNTPASYGILLIPMFIYLVIQGGTWISTALAFALLWGLGLWDDIVKYFLFKRSGKWGISMSQKLIIQFISIGIVVAASSGLTSNILLILVIVLMMVLFVNSYNITDGLDGLVASMTLIMLPVLYLSEYTGSRDSMYLNLYVLLFIFTLVFYVFNRKPAKVWLGDTGAMGLGFLLSLAFLRYNFALVIILFAPILFEGMSSLVQMASIRLFKKRIFKIAPFHLHLLNSGWREKWVVASAAIVQLLCAAIALLVTL